MQTQQNLRNRLSDQQIRSAMTGIPAVVTEFVQNGDDEPYVNVKISINWRTFEAGRAEDIDEHVEILEVPIGYMSTSLGAVTVPIAPDDEGFLWFSDRDLDEWQFDPAKFVKQDRARSKNINDAIFFPGVWKRVKGLCEYNQEAIEMRTLDNLNKVSVSEDGVEITGKEVNINAGVLNINGVAMTTMNPQLPASYTPVVPAIPPLPCVVKRP